MAMTSNLVILQTCYFSFEENTSMFSRSVLEGGPIFKEIMFPRNYAHPYLTTRTNAQKGGTTVPVNRYIRVLLYVYLYALLFV